MDDDAWHRYSGGDGAKGHRFYDWAWIHLGPTEQMLARRSISNPTS